ncbi:hypothetical protein MP638_007121, partial [Amoeboaphelidium occidentale]
RFHFALIKNAKREQSKSLVFYFTNRDDHLTHLT